MAIISIQVHGLSVKMIDEGDRVVAHHLAGGFEPQTSSAWMLALERSRGLALDVGAYTGYYSILACRAGVDVLAIEPHLPNIRRMRANFSVNGVSPMIIQGAASDRRGRADFHFNGGLELTSGGTLEAPSGMQSSRAETSLFEIDALALSTVAAIKIDVEGHEPSVLRGAQQIVERDRPMLFVEALTAAALAEVKSLLPDYVMTAMLDGRNAIFQPLGQRS